jgi:class 3 adenylate cyclase
LEARVEAERRQVTVLFADMVGFTSFSERSGEEAAYTLMRSLSKLMDEAVREHGGVVQSFTGDGIMAVFGAPVAFEDAPLRACRAALAILQRLKTAGPDLEVKHRVKPQLRIGLNTGTAVVGKVQEGTGRGRSTGNGTWRHCELRVARSSLGQTRLSVHDRGDVPISARAGGRQLGR